MDQRLNKTVICSVVFLDIEDYSRKSVAEQLDCKRHFNQLVGEAIRNVAENDRLMIDTGDGAGLAFMGAPEDALFVSLAIRDALAEYSHSLAGGTYRIRTGINLGPVRIVNDINGLPNIIGDGMNVAERVMNFAEPGQILVSRSYYEVVASLSADILQLFSYGGHRSDKHVRDHEVYMVAERPIAAENSAELSDGKPTPWLSRALPRRTHWIALGALGIGLALTAMFWMPVSEPQADFVAEPDEMPSTETPAAELGNAPSPSVETHKKQKSGHNTEKSRAALVGGAEAAPANCTEAARMLKQCN